MKMKCFSGLLASVGRLNNKVVCIFEGVMFDCCNKINLHFYLQGIDNAYVVGEDLLKFESYLCNLSSKVLDFKTSKEAELPLKIGGNIKRMNHLDERFVSFIERSGSAAGMIFFDLEKNKRAYVPDTGGSIIVKDDLIIFRQCGKVLCYNWNENEIWEFNSGQNADGVNEDLYNYRQSVIFNSGDYGDGQSQLIRLEKSTGKVIWKKAFGQLIDNALMIGERIYVAIANQMLIVSPDTAEVLISFTADLVETEHSTTLWTDGQVLYVLAAQSNQILCYSIDGSTLIKKYQLPQHPDLKHGSIPYSFDDAHYLGLVPGYHVIAGVEGGLLTWTTEDVLSGKELEIEEKPWMPVITVKEGKSAESYYVTVSCRKLDEVLRFGEIEARMLAALRGKQMWDNEETRNKKFNGDIKLLIDPVIGKENAPYLDMLAKRSTSFAKVMDIKSGNGKKPIAVSWAFMDEV